MLNYFNILRDMKFLTLRMLRNKIICLPTEISSPLGFVEYGVNERNVTYPLLRIQVIVLELFIELKLNVALVRNKTK